MNFIDGPIFLTAWVLFSQANYLNHSDWLAYCSVLYESTEHADDTEDRKCQPAGQKIALTLGNPCSHWMDAPVKSNQQRYPLDFYEITLDNSNRSIFAPANVSFYFNLLCFSLFNHYASGLSAIKFSLHVSFIKTYCYNPSLFPPLSYIFPSASLINSSTTTHLPRHTCLIWLTVVQLKSYAFVRRCRIFLFRFQGRLKDTSICCSRNKA